MKKILLLMLVLGLASSAIATVRIDDFERANGALGSMWTQTLANPLQINFGGVYGASSDGYPGFLSGESDGIWTGDTFGSDQFSEILLRTWYRTQWMGVWVRRQAEPDQGYLILYYSGSFMLFAHASGGWRQLYTQMAATPVPGDKIKLVAAGSSPVVLSVYSNGTLLFTYSDSTYNFMGGAPGIATSQPEWGSIESWAGGDGDGSGVTHPVPPAPWRPLPGNGMFVYNERIVSVTGANGTINQVYLDFISAHSANGGGAITLRYVVPDSPSTSRPHRFLFVLPVSDGVPGPADSWGDGVYEIVSHNYHNLYNYTVVTPGFGLMPWYADHPTDVTKQQESFMLLEFAPWVALNLGTTGTETSSAIGFSKSGYGGLDLMFRNPNLFNAGAFWDFPADMVWSDTFVYGGGDVIYGTEANFENNYQLTQNFINAHKAPFLSHARLWLSGDPVVFQTAVQNFAHRLDTAGIPYLYSDDESNSGLANNTWASGWVARAIVALDGLVVGVQSLELNPTSVVGGTKNSKGTVTLSAPAVSPTKVALSSSDTSTATVPASVTVAAGATQATFTVTSQVVTAPASAVITATLNGSATATLTVNPLLVALLTMNRTMLAGGITNATGTVTLNAPAAGTAAQRTVALLSDNPTAATVPASVTVASGSTTANFAVTSYAVAALSTANISATLNGSSRSVLLTITPPPAMQSLTLNPTSVVGGAKSVATVTLTFPAAGTATQRSVTLLSSDTASATVPASVTVAAGATQATFTVTSQPVSTAANPVITATLNGSASATLTVNPLLVASLTMNRTMLAGGITNATGTVTLNLPAVGTTAQRTVALLSDNPTAASVPTGVTVAAGATTATFTVTSHAVPALSTANISATLNGSSRTVLLTITPPPAMQSLTLNPTSVVGGRSPLQP